MPSFNLRAAVPDDSSSILSLIKALALYEKDVQSVKAAEELIRQHCFGQYSNVVLAEVDGQAVGMALYFFNFSTWTGRPGLYLEDLFVEEPYRKLGVGKALFAYLGNIEQRHCSRMEWVVLDWNTPAKEFYTHKLGAKHQAAWEIMRLEGTQLDDLQNLATL